MDARVRNQVRLELVQVDVEGAVETQGRGDGRDNLRNQAVEMLVAGAGNVQVSAADIVHGLVVDEERAVRVLDRAVGGQDGVVGLNDGGRHPRGRVDGELQLALLPVVGRQALEEERAEARTGAAAERVEDEEALEGVAVVCDAALDTGWGERHFGSSGQRTSDTTDAVNDTVGHLLANGIVATGIVVGGILFPADQQLGVEQLTVRAGTDLIDGRRVQIDEEGPGNVFAAARLGEEGLERPGVTRVLDVGVGATIGPETMLEEVAGVYTLADVQRFARAVRLTAPRRCCPAGYQPGPGGDEESATNYHQLYDYWGLDWRCLVLVG